LLSEELLNVGDRRAKQTKRNRSDLIETAAWEMVHRLAREEENSRDLAFIERHADVLNQEAADALIYQKPW
jgi:hypothetical protein